MLGKVPKQSTSLCIIVEIVMIHKRVITFTEECVIKVKTSAIFLKSKCDPRNIHKLMQSTIRSRFIVCCILMCQPPAVFVFSNTVGNINMLIMIVILLIIITIIIKKMIFIITTTTTIIIPTCSSWSLHRMVCVRLPRLLDENWCHSVNKVYCSFQMCRFNFYWN